MIRVYRLFLLFLSLFSIVNSSEQQRAEIEVFAPRNPQHLFTVSYSDTHNTFCIEYYNDGSSKIRGALSSLDPKLSSIIENMHQRAIKKMQADGVKIVTPYGSTTQEAIISINTPDEFGDKKNNGCFKRFFKFIWCY